MTLCLAWKSIDGRIHFAADSRITLGDAFADVAIKVATLPYRISGVVAQEEQALPIMQGEIGLTFCGSTVSMFALKESISEVLLHFQCVHAEHVSLRGICDIIFATYKQILPKVIEAMLSEKGIANVLVAGFCPREKRELAFLIQTNGKNVSSMREVLEGEMPPAVVLGSGTSAAKELLSQIPRPTNTQYLDTLNAVINDDRVDSVGGQIVYGHTEGEKFLTFGVTTVKEGVVSYWRGGLNFNESTFLLNNDGGLHVYYPMLMG